MANDSNIANQVSKLDSEVKTLQATLSQLQSAISSAFDPSVVTGFVSALRGVKVHGLLEVGTDAMQQDLNRLKKSLESAQAEIENLSGKKLQEKINNIADLKRQIKDIEKGDTRRSAEAIDLIKKELNAVKSAETAKQNALYKTIDTYQRYYRQIKETELQITRERTQDGGLTARGAQLQKEVDGLKELLNAYRQTAQSLRASGATLTDGQKLELYITNLKKLRAIQDRFERGQTDNKGTDYGQQQAKAAQDVARTNKDIVIQASKRLALEQKLAQTPKGDKEYTKIANDLDKVNAKIKEMVVTLTGLGTRGRSALEGLVNTGMVRVGAGKDLASFSSDITNQQLRAYREYLELQRRNAKLTYDRDNGEKAGSLNFSAGHAINKRLQENEQRMAELKKRFNEEELRSNETTKRKLEQLETEHQNNLTNIILRGERTRKRIQERQNLGSNGTASLQEQIKMLKEINRLELENEKIKNKLSNNRYNNPTSVGWAKDQLATNEQRRQELLAQINMSQLSTSAQTKAEYERMESEHQNRLTQIVIQGEQEREKARQRSTEKEQRDRLADQKLFDKQQKDNAKQQTKQNKQYWDGYNNAVKKQMANLKTIYQARNEIQKIANTADLRKRKGIVITDAEKEAEVKRLEELKRKLQEAQNAYRETEGKYRGSGLAAHNQMGGFNRNLMTQEALRYGRAISDLEKKLKKAAEAQEKLKAGVSNLGHTLASIFSVYQIKNFVSELVRVRGEFEMSEVALNNIIGNQEKSMLVWKKTMNLAVNSPLTAQQLTKYTKQLAAFRVQTDKLYDTTKMLGDISVGLGVDMERLILAYGHTKSAGFLSGIYARQLATAGVNIYGELADFYTKTEGHLVKVTDVYQRMRKKLVSFEDVEQVFKKLTSEGGTFYNMQQVLTDTVQGQMNKISDSWQQMLNEIGKGTTGLLRTVTDLTLGVIKNWRIWLSVIEGVLAGVALFKTIQLASVMYGWAAATNTASTAMRGFALAVKRAGAALKANWVALVISSVIAVGVAFATMKKHMDDFNEQIDEEGVKLYDAQQKMYDYQKRIEKNNKTLKEAKKNEVALKEAREDNLDVLNKLRAEYPELAEGAKQEANGVVELTDKINLHNKSLEQQLLLMEEIKQKSIFDDPFETDVREYQEALQKVTKEIKQVQLKLKKQLWQNKLNKDDSEIANQILQLNPDTDPLQAMESYNKLAKEWNKALSKLQSLRKEPFKYKEYQELKKSRETSMWLLPWISVNQHDLDEFNREKEKIVSSLAFMFEDLIKTNDKYAKEIEEQYNGNFAAFFRANKMTLLKEVKDGTNDWNQTIRDFLEKHGFALNEYSRKIWNDIINTFIEGYDTVNEIADLKALEAKIKDGIFPALVPELTINGDYVLDEKGEKKMTALVFGEMDEYTARIQRRVEWLQGNMYNFFEKYLAPNDNTNGDDDDNKTRRNINELIELLKTMNKEYDKLSKEAYGFKKANDEVMDSFYDAVQQVFNIHGIQLLDWNKIEIDSKAALRRTLNDLKNTLDNDNLWGLFGKTEGEIEKAKGLLEKAISTADAEMRISIEVERRKNFEKEMEKMFSDYELTIEMQNLDVPEDFAKIWLDIDYTSLGEIQDKINDFLKIELTADQIELKDGTIDYRNSFSTEDLDAYLKYSEKVSKEIFNARKKRLDEYGRFAEKEYSELAKIEMKHAQDVAFVKINFEGEKRENILTRLDAKFQKDLSELHWKSFKESSFYVEMMDDLASLPSDYLRVLLSKMDELLKTPEKFNAKELKEIVKARQKIIEAQISARPLRSMSGFLRAFRDNSKDSLRTQLGVKSSTLKGANKEIDENVIKLNQQSDALRKVSEELFSVQSEFANYEEALKNRNKVEEKLSDSTLEALKDKTIADVISARKKELDDVANKIKELTESNAEELDKNNSDELNLSKARQAALQNEINLLQEYAYAIKHYEQIRSSLKKVTINEAGIATSTVNNVTYTSSSQVESDLNENQKRSQDLDKQISDWQRFKKNIDDIAKSIKKFNEEVNQSIEKVKGAGVALYDMFDALGANTNVLTEEWKNFSVTMLDTISKSLTMIPQLVEGIVSAETAVNTAAGIIGLIAEGVTLIANAVTAFAKLHDAHYEKEIEDQQEKIDALKDAYEELQKAIEKTLSSADYMANYDATIDNINEQIKRTQAQLNAERSKKNPDKEKIKELEKSVEELKESAEEAAKALSDTFLGFNKDNFRDITRDFVDAWLDAYKETGDGYDALMEQFQSKMEQWFVNQTIMRVVGKKMEPLLEQMVAAVDEYSEAGSAASLAEINDAWERAQLTFSQVNDMLKPIASQFRVGGDGSLSGLAQGIQGMSEETADVLAGYWNSVRQYTANIDLTTMDIRNILQTNFNPMLQQVSIIANNMIALRSLMESTAINNGQGRGFRVYSV